MLCIFTGNRTPDIGKQLKVHILSQFAHFSAAVFIIFACFVWRLDGGWMEAGGVTRGN